MGIVPCPVPGKYFDGKMFLMEVSEDKEFKRATTNQNVTHDIMVNIFLKKGGWCEFYLDDTSMQLWEHNLLEIPTIQKIQLLCGWFLSSLSTCVAKKILRVSAQIITLAGKV